MSNYFVASRPRRVSLTNGYAVQQQSKRGAPPALGDVLDTLANVLGGPIAGAYTSWEIGTLASSPGIQNCINQANATDQVAALDDRRNDISKNWNPTGFYSAAQITEITNQVMGLLGTVQVQISLAPLSSGDAASQIRQAMDTVGQKITAGQAYIAAAAQAGASGVVNAPGLKSWVVTSMGAASQSMVTAYALSCDQMAIQRVLGLVATYYETVWAVVMAIPGVIAKAGDLIVSAADTVGTLLTVAKWAIVIGGGFFVYTKVKEAGYLKRLGKK